MSVRRWIAAVCLVAGVLPFAPDTFASTSGTLRLTGRAGLAIPVLVSRGTTVPTTADDSPATSSSGGWAGFALVDPSLANLHHAPGTDAFVSISFTQGFRCPASSCPYTTPLPTAGGDEAGRIGAGHDWLVLLGPPGSTVKVTFHPHTGQVTLDRSRTSRLIALSSQVTTGVGPAGHESVLHSYGTLPAGKGLGVAVGYDLMALSPAGFTAQLPCWTAGGQDHVGSSVGGIGPCVDEQSEGGVVSASVGPSTPSYGYAPVQGNYVMVDGPQDGDMFGIGFDHAVNAPSSYLRSLFVGFSLPLTK